jgi:pyrroloquinoline quinone biosynthesis protein D
MLLAPERVIEMEGPANEILRRCDGMRTTAQIVDELAVLYGVDRATIEGDVNAMLTELSTKRLVVR